MRKISYAPYPSYLMLIFKAVWISCMLIVTLGSPVLMAKMRSTSQKMSLSFQSLCQSEPRQHPRGRWQRSKNSEEQLISYCLKTQSWCPITLSKEVMKNTTSIPKMGKGLASAFWISWNVFARFSRPTARPDHTANNSAKPIRYFIKREHFAISQKFWTQPKKASLICG